MACIGFRALRVSGAPAFLKAHRAWHCRQREHTARASFRGAFVTLRDDIPPQAQASWPFVKRVFEHEVVDSTNDVAARLVRDPVCSLPLAVWAHRQTRGRGRGSHTWWSDDGSLTFTLAIDPAAHGLAQVLEPRVALGTAVAVIEAIRELGYGQTGLGIRWPNDLECGGRKLGGILPEVVELEAGRRLLIGVGLNVRTNLADAPDEVQAMATSLATMFSSGIEHELMPRLLAAILRHFAAILRPLSIGDPELGARWNELDVLRGCLVRVDAGSHVVEGRAVGIDALGALCLDHRGATIELFGGTVLR
jgi:BirA family transcriptional regulator, biotin operon repressor / biotin---[acetyl-CoA-carboxylase] ligase